MSKNRIGILRGKPIVEGDKNVVTSNEIHISDLSSSNEGSSVIYFKCNNVEALAPFISAVTDEPYLFGSLYCIGVIDYWWDSYIYFSILSNNISITAEMDLSEIYKDQEGYAYFKMFSARLITSEPNQGTHDQLQAIREHRNFLESFNDISSIKEIVKHINSVDPDYDVDVESVVDITKEEYEQFYKSAKQLNN